MNNRILLFSSFHYDVAYMKTFEGYMPECLEIINAGLDLLDEFPDYVFCIEQIILVDAYWQRLPENRDRLKKHAREQRLIFCPGMWTMPDGNIPSAESSYQNALLGRKWLKEHLDVEPGPICWMADIFGHHLQSPQIYKQLGYRMYMFERGQLENEDNVDFLWEGIDGTKLLTHWEADTYYGLSMGLCWLADRPVSLVTDRIRTIVIDPLARTCSGDLLTKIGGDFCVPKREHLDYIEMWNKNKWGPTIEFSRPDSYIDKVEQNSGLKIIDSELNPLFQGTHSTRIRLKQFNKKLESLVYSLESLAVRLGIDIDAGPLWKTIATQQFHDIICGSLGDAAWKEAIDLYQMEYLKSQDALLQQLQGKGGKETVIFNPLPFERTEVVDLPNGARLLSLGAMQITTLDNAPEVKTSSVVAKDNILENGLIRAHIDEFGRLKKLEDLATGNIYEDSRYGYIHDVFLEQDYGDCWVYHRGPVNYSLLHVAPYNDPIKLSQGEIVREGLFLNRGADSQCYKLPQIETYTSSNGCRATIIAKYETNMTVQYTLCAQEQLLRIGVEHKRRSIQCRLRAAMPTGILNGTIRRETPAGWVEQPEGEYPTQTWMDYSDDQKGLCLLNRGLPGNNVTDGVMMLTLFRSVAMLEAEQIPDFELDVDQVAEYALCPFRPGDQQYLPARLGQCFNQPIAIAPDAAKPTDNGLHIRLEPATAQIIAVRSADEDRTVELRLYDSSGTATTVNLHASKPLKSASHVTPLGEIINNLEIKDQASLQISLGPFEIATVLLR